MPVPKQRHTRSHRNRRRSHHALKTRIFGVCQKCHQPVLPHTACPNCGTYQNREVIDVLKKLTKREKKLKEKELETQEKETAGAGSMEELSRK